MQGVKGAGGFFIRAARLNQNAPQDENEKERPAQDAVIGKGDGHYRWHRKGRLILRPQVPDGCLRYRITGLGVLGEKHREGYENQCRYDE
jgi:hypothetical protein